MQSARVFVSVRACALVVMLWVNFKHEGTNPDAGEGCVKAVEGQDHTHSPTTVPGRRVTAFLPDAVVSTMFNCLRPKCSVLKFI